MGSSIIKGSVKKFMFIYNFLRGCFTTKVVENSLQNAGNCTISKKFLGAACPQTHQTKARSFAARDMPLRGMYIQNPRNFKVGPHPLRDPAYAPGMLAIENYLRQLQCKVLLLLLILLNIIMNVSIKLLQLN